MTRRTRILAIAAAVLATLAGLLTFAPIEPVLIAARIAALVTIVHLIWRYHRLADWSGVEIGKSTMAIKGSILVLVLGANLRTLDDYTRANVHLAAEIGIVLGWLCMAAALVHRDRLVVRLQGEAHALPAPPPKHYLPSEGYKQESE